MRLSVGDDGDIDSENQRNINDGDDYLAHIGLRA